MFLDTISLSLVFSLQDYMPFDIHVCVVFNDHQIALVKASLLEKSNKFNSFLK